MTPILTLSYLLIALFNGGVHSAVWSATSLPDGHHLYACAGDTVDFHWQYALTTGEVLGDVQWLYDGQSQMMVAITTRGNFLPTPSFSQRVARVDNAGLSLSRVLVLDSGNYSVEVNVYTQAGATHTLLHRTAVLHVTDRLMTTDGVLHVTQLRDPVYDTVTGQWVLQLQCGNFIFKNNPPYQVEWTTPSGHVVSSTSFSNGNFYLFVPMPIESGSYTCRIPSHLSARACLHGNGTSEGRASVTVESVEARLLLLEKENSDLKHKLTAAQAALTLVNNQQQASLNHLTNETADLSHRLTTLQTSQGQENTRLNTLLHQTQNQLTATAANLTTRLAKIEDAERTQVAFHATGLLSQTVAVNSPLVFNHAVYNLGNAYSAATGYFTAPYAGLYFFIAKTTVFTGSGAESHSLLVDNAVIDTAHTNNLTGVQDAEEQSPVHGVVHLVKGQRVYVRSDGRSPYSSAVSAFTGFLLSRDP